MAWGSPKAPPPPQSALSKLLPMIIFFIIAGGLAFVGFHVYMIVNSIADTTNKKLEKRNVTFTKDGMKVGVKQVNNERYVDKTQRVQEPSLEQADGTRAQEELVPVIVFIKRETSCCVSNVVIFNCAAISVATCFDEQRKDTDALEACFDDVMLSCGDDDD